ncbi:MAG: hypothetical protein IH891_00210 [Planctomycetes bacterium]|nr:hypothetical protein [Planctomycetota bacterium]
MANVTTVTYSSKNQTKPKYSPTKETRLYKGDTLTIKLNKFPPNSTIEMIRFDYEKAIKGKHKKDIASPLGSWTARSGNSSGLNGHYLCAADSAKQSIIIVNIEDNEDDERYWFSASGTIGGTKKTWSIDPEVINKGR